MGYVREYDWEGDEMPAAMAFLSACLRIRLTDAERTPLKGGRCRIAGREDAVHACDAGGVAEIPIGDRSRKTVVLEWEGPDGSGAFPWSNSFDLSVASAQDLDCAIRLTHLGFPGDELARQVSAYQAHFGRPPTGKLDDIRGELARWHDGGGPPLPEGAAAGAGSAAASSSEAKALAEKLYLAFNDSGFLGMGGTDEEGVLVTLRAARDRGLMREVDAQYRESYPGEPGLAEELDDELSGEEYGTAMRMYEEGMRAPSQASPAAGGGPSPAGPAVPVLGTLAPGALASVRVLLLDADLNPMPHAACRLAGIPDRLFAADAEGYADLPVHAGAARLEIEWEDADAAPDEGPDLPRFYYRQAVDLKPEAGG